MLFGGALANATFTATLPGHPDHLNFLVVGLVSLLFAWGLWTLKRWAFWATVIIEIISLINSVLAFTQPHANFWSAAVGMIIPIVILVYFFADANVRAAFRT